MVLDLLGASSTWGILFLVIAAGVSAAYAIDTARQSTRLRRRGAQTTATITTRELRRRTMQLQPGQMLSSKVPVLGVRYTPSDGRQRTLEVDVSHPLFDQVEAGSEIALTYLPERPAIFEVEPGSIGKAGRIGWWLVAAFLFAAAMLLWSVAGKGG